MTKIIGLTLLLLASSPLLAAEPHSLSVRGEGEMKVAPDVAVISLAVHTKDKDAHAAQEANAREMARVKKILKNDFHLEEKDLQTTSFAVSPEYRIDRNGKQTFLGYQADHGLDVKVKLLDKVGPLLDQLMVKQVSEATLLSVQGVSYDTDRRKEYETEALGLAMSNAKARADALAGFAKRGLKGVLRISDSNVQFANLGGGANNRHVFATSASMTNAPTDLSGGQITISSSVSVEYEID